MKEYYVEFIVDETDGTVYREWGTEKTIPQQYNKILVIADVVTGIFDENNANSTAKFKDQLLCLP